MLTVEKASLHYGAAQALRGVSLTADMGRITCVLGRNGVGKSSLLRAITGQHPLSGGAIRFNGVELDATGRVFSDSRERGVAFTESTNQGADLSLRVGARPARGWSWSLLGYLQGRTLSSRFASVTEDRATASPVTA